MVLFPFFPPALSWGPLATVQLVLSLRLVLMRRVIGPARWMPPAVSALLGCLAGMGLCLLHFLPCGRIGGLATM